MEPTTSAGQGERGAWKKTRRSLIEGLKRGDRKVAMPAFCEAYWGPLWAFICGKGCPPGDAQDVTQSFFAAMMSPGFFDGFDPARGTFRNWLRTAAKRHYFNWWRQRPRELPDADPATIDDRLEREWDATPEQDRAFDRALADAVVRRALERLRRRYADDGQSELFDQLHVAALGERRMTGDATLSRLVGKSVSLLKKEKFVAKQKWMLQYKACLRDELAAFGVRRADIESVVADLLDASR
jgi:DNA-directed RNA polymerase specialized sigma24 family protein